VVCPSILPRVKAPATTADHQRVTLAVGRFCPTTASTQLRRLSVRRSAGGPQWSASEWPIFCVEIGQALLYGHAYTIRHWRMKTLFDIQIHRYWLTARACQPDCAPNGNSSCAKYTRQTHDARSERESIDINSIHFGPWSARPDCKSRPSRVRTRAKWTYCARPSGTPFREAKPMVLPHNHLGIHSQKPLVQNSGRPDRNRVRSPAVILKDAFGIELR
jgi:hypothetical protein